MNFEINSNINVRDRTQVEERPEWRRSIRALGLRGYSLWLCHFSLFG